MELEQLISKKVEQELLQRARSAIHAALHKTPLSSSSQPIASMFLRATGGVFVAIWMGNELRGCMGTPYPNPSLSLLEAVQQSAVMSVLQDDRFRPLSAVDLPLIKIEISILSSPQPIEPSQIQVGIHGVMVSQGDKSDVLLPKIALDYGWDLKTFLEMACRKAGLLPHAWEKGASLSAFKVHVFSEN